MGLSESKILKHLRTSSILTDCPTNTISGKTNSQQIKSYQNMKCIISPKRFTSDYSDMERKNIYAETPPKLKTTLVNDTNHYMPTPQQRRPPVPIRTDSSRSIGSITTSSFSSQSATPSNSFRQDPTVMMTRSVDASSCGLSSQIKTIKSKSTQDIETSILHNNNKHLNMIANGNFVPLQSVKEDECLEVENNNNNNNNEKYSKNDTEQQCMIIDILKQKYSQQDSPASMMPQNNSLHQRASSTDEDKNTNGFTRNHRIRSSLPFIMKPAVNTSKSNSLGLCFLICSNETKKVLLPSYISCLDTLKALFVRAFPQHLTMKQMDTDNIRIYIRELEKDIFYQLEDIKDVKDRSVLKLVQLNDNKPHVSFKQPETEEMTYQRLSRFVRIADDTSTLKIPDNPSRSLSEPRHRVDTNETKPVVYAQASTVLRGILSSPRSGSTTPRIDEDDARTKMVLMEKQLESLTELVKELTNSQQIPIKKGILIEMNNKSLYQQLYELKVKTHTLRNDLLAIRRMQQSLQENLKMELEGANKKIEEQVARLNQNEKYRNIENEFDLYIKSSTKINRDLEDLEISVEELQNDVKSKQCRVTMNNVESFALVLSTISRSLVDLKASFPELREKLSLLDQQSTITFLSEEPERLDYTIKKCKRLTTMLYQLKRIAINQEQKRSSRKITFNINQKSVDRKNFLEEIQSIALNSEGRIKAAEKAEKLRERRLYYENQLENLKQMKTTTSNQTEGNFDSRSLTNSLSTRTSICSTDSNNCSSPSLSYIVRQALISSTNDSKIRVQSSIKPPSKVTFSQQLITTEKSSLKNNICLNKKSKPTPPPRVQSTPSSSAVSSASSSSSSSCTGGNLRLANGFCGIIPLLSPDRRHNGRCYSFSSSSTDTDSVISNSQKSSTVINPKFHQTTLMRASVTDL